jgi:ribosome-associated translation inhibitor RaiA
MQIQVHTDNHIEGKERLVHFVETEIKDKLARFADRVTRVEVYLSETNSHNKSDDDKKCTIEARLSGHEPNAVSHQAGTLDAAIHGAIDKIKKNLDTTIGKLDKK